MDSRAVVRLTALALAALSTPASAQVRSSIVMRPPVPATGLPPQGPPRQPPANPPAAPPFRSGLVVFPKRVPPHPSFPVRLPWFGLVYFDPYWWALDAVDPGYPLEVQPQADFRPTGGLQLDVEPRRAFVYVDGRFVGPVDAFSGYFRHLDLPAGPHLVEFVATDYDPFVADIVVAPGRTTTYRASLNRAR